MLYIESLMAEDTENFEVDRSHDLDMVALFISSNHDAEMEANAINGLLEASGIPSMVVGTAQIPSLEFQVQVPRARLEEAERLLAEAKDAGPAAAAEAEEAGEEGGG
jgi:Putative prokaryotic signal transducing protein